MADLASLPTHQLFKQWRAGDANSGAAMAQRFSDWYYAVTTVRLGDAHGRAPLQRACTRFQQGIVSVTDPLELTDWAHGLLADEIQQAGGRIAGGDYSSAMTGGRTPSELLGRAAIALPPAQVALLAHAYDAGFPMDAVSREAEALGGMPLAVLEARLALKRWLRDHESVGFSEVPDQPNLDCAPLPLYEAARMTVAAEEVGFEKWLLSDMALCKDVAEFGVFALALRGGAFSLSGAPRGEAARPAAPARPVAARTPPPAVTAKPPPSGRGTVPLLAGAGVLVLVVAALVGLALLAVSLLG